MRIMAGAGAVRERGQGRGVFLEIKSQPRQTPGVRTLLSAWIALHRENAAGREGPCPRSRQGGPGQGRAYLDTHARG